MPRSPTYGLRATTPALGVLRQRTHAGFPGLLKATATYAWLGEDYAGANWTDLVAGVVASPGVAPSVTTLNGRRALGFNGTQYLVTPAFASAVAQPYGLVVVVLPGGSGSILDGIDVDNRANIAYVSNDTVRYISGASEQRWTTVRLETQVARWTINGTSSFAWRDGQPLSVALGATPGGGGVTGLTIGGTYTFSALATNGTKIALIAIVAGADYAARAARIEAAALAYYGIAS